VQHPQSVILNFVGRQISVADPGTDGTRVPEGVCGLAPSGRAGVRAPAGGFGGEGPRSWSL